MNRKIIIILLIVSLTSVHAEIKVTTVDFLQPMKLEVNGAGPLLTLMDETRNRIIMANTLTASVSVIDGATHQVANIALSNRSFQHLKADALRLNEKTGDVYLIGKNCFFIVYVDQKKSKTILTEKQFESIAVDENTGNVFLAGRESDKLAFYTADRKKIKLLNWLDFLEHLINMNATPPPPIRKVIADNNLGQIVAVDGYTATIYIFDSNTGKLIKSQTVELSKGGRWHYAGYNQQTHCLYLVVEKQDRKVVQAAKIDVVSGNNVIVPLPGLTEGVGVNYNPLRDEVYVPYDNHPTAHVVDFKNGGKVSDIFLPAFGNDASAIDLKNEILYIASWAHGEVDVVDLKSRKLIERVPEMGIIPHMFNMVFNPINNLLYIPSGASGVNGSFGAAISVFDIKSEKIVEKIYTGWTPIDLIEMKDRNSFLVFNNEDKFAEVKNDGSFEIYQLPYAYPVSAIHNPQGDVYLSYGPHQSYWPTVYIWDAKNGILKIDKEKLGFYDRRIPRQAHRMVFDKNNVCYFTQNNWGGEEQFLGRIGDDVRLFEIGARLSLKDTVTREITQRILKYEKKSNWLYLVRVGETENEPSILQIIDPDSSKVLQRLELGKTTTDLIFDDEKIYAADFGSNQISVISKNNFSIGKIKTGNQPLKLCRRGNRNFVINHLDNTLQEIGGSGKVIKIPFKGLPDNIFNWRGNLVITSHSPDALNILSFNPMSEKFSLLHQLKYPFGDTRFDSRNVSFYVDGQFGDAVFFINRAEVDQNGNLWVTDFLSGKVFIISGE